MCTDSAGNSNRACDYLPTNYRFAGMEWDSETSLYHTWFRQYDPNQGRWMSVDPLPGSPDDPQSLNRYSYVRNDSVNLTDPSGLCTVSFDYSYYLYGYISGGIFHVVGGWIEITNFRTDCGTQRLGEGGGPGGGNTSGGLNGAINQARLMLSNPDCANFLKGVLTNLGYAPNLDSFLKEFDHLTIIPTPGGDAKSDPGFLGNGFTAHIAFGTGQSSTVHVDAPRAADLVPTLLHETFHDTLYAVGDPRLAAAATGDRSYLNVTQKTASRAANTAFGKHCTPK